MAEIRQPNKNRKFELIDCSCNCGAKLNKYDGRNRERKSLRGHQKIQHDKQFNKGHIPFNKGTKGLVNAWNKGKSMKDYPQIGFQKKHKIGIGNQNVLGRKLSDEHKKKLSEAHKGAKAYNYNNSNNRTERQRLMGQLEYRLWRTAVFVRDDYTCQNCFIRGNKLEADHIKPWALYPELRFAIDNGRTLCISCHRQTDTWGGRIFARKEGA